MLVGMLAQASIPTAGISADASEIEQLRRELAEHRKYVESLEKRLQSQEEKLAKDPGIEAGYDDGLFIKSKEKPFSMVFNGLGQFTSPNTPSIRPSLTAWRISSVPWKKGSSPIWCSGSRRFSVSSPR